MELTVAEAAAVLGKSPRMVRHLIQTGRLQASRRGRLWMIPQASLPQDARRQSRESARRARVRKVVEKSLEREVPARPATTAAEKPSRQARESTFSLAGCRLYSRALELYALLRALPEPFQGRVATLPSPGMAFLEGLRALSVGYFQFERAVKRDAYLRARHCFARALSDLVVVVGPVALQASAGTVGPGVPPTTAGDSSEVPAGGDAAAEGMSSVPEYGVVERELELSLARPVIQGIERDLLPGMGKLLRRLERRP